MTFSLKRVGSYAAVASTAFVLAMAGTVDTADAAKKKKKFAKPVCDTIEVISHASPGGGTDTTARMMMIRARRYLKSSGYLKNDMIVVYKRGGMTRKAHEYFKRQPADGCTWMAITQSHMNVLATKSPITIDDMVGIARAMDDPIMFVVNAESPYKTLKDAVEASKKKPLSWAGAGANSTDHIAIDKLARAAGIKYKFVSYGSAGPMVSALLAKSYDVAPLNVSETADQLAEKKFRAIAVLSKKRLGDYPNVPTAAEQGYNVFASTTRGYVVRKGTPDKVVDYLSGELVKAMRHKVFAGYLAGSGLNAKDAVSGRKDWQDDLKEIDRKSV
ncbi:MAG: tripartite tricarboxylate transporter substrate binding protein, partial [Rhodospirillales bacterium]